MSVRNLEYLFRPRSVAVVGASDTPDSYGAVVLKNLSEGGFEGAIMPVSVSHRTLFGHAGHPKVEEVRSPPDLAVLCSPADTLPDVVSQLGAMGTKAVILACPLAADARTASGAGLRDALLEAARPHLTRIVGPGSAGLVVPRLGLNASFAHAPVVAGRIAFVSQAVAVTAAVLDWGRSRGIGFSCLLHLGESVDVDLADVLDYLASDPDTASILLHFESVLQGQKFMSAARAAARNKPVIAMRPGRVAEGSRVGATRAAALIEIDDIYAAAMRRAGIVRVFTSEGLFEAAEAMAWAKPSAGDRLAIIANGAGFGRVAADALRLNGGRLAAFSADTTLKLGQGIAATRIANPLELAPDVPAHSYADALRVVLQSPDVDAVLLIHAPTAFADAAGIAAAVCDAAEGAERSVFTCWVGGDAVRDARRVASSRGLPSYDAPEKAVEVFLGIVQYGRNRELLMQTPPSVPAGFAPDSAKARRLVARALRSGRDRLLESEAKALLAAYGLPVLESPVSRTQDQAARVAAELGFPVLLKMLVVEDNGVVRVGGVERDLESAAQVRKAARSLSQRLRERQGSGRVRGFSVQKMVPRPGAHELMVGVASDPVFGPVILFGSSSGAATIRDVAVALPPLNMLLARELVSRTRAARLLAGSAERPAADVEAICLALVQVSQLLVDVDEIAELEIDPLLADAHGVLALDARVRVVPHRRHRGSRRFAIRPYPQELEQPVVWSGQSILLRPIRPEDELAHSAFLDSLSAEDARYRFFGTMRHLPHTQLARYTQIDYDREMAFVAIGQSEAAEAATLGEVRAVADPDNEVAEFAIVVRSELKGSGLGRLLLDCMIAYLRDRGTRELRGETLLDNDRMQNLARDCGFKLKRDLVEGIVELRLPLQEALAG